MNRGRAEMADDTDTVPGYETRAIAPSLSVQGVTIGVVLAFIIGGAGGASRT